MATKDQVYGAFVDYYGDISLNFVKTTGPWVIYGAKAFSGLNQQRYIFVIVPVRLARGEQTTLDQLDWVSFQTRTSDENHNVPTHHIFTDANKQQVLVDHLSVSDRTRDETIYVTSSLPIKIRLLHDPKKNNYLQYPDSLKLYQALNSYQCVVELL